MNFSDLVGSHQVKPKALLGLGGVTDVSPLSDLQTNNNQQAGTISTLNSSNIATNTNKMKKASGDGIFYPVYPTKTGEKTK